MIFMMGVPIMHLQEMNMSILQNLLPCTYFDTFEHGVYSMKVVD